MSESWRRLSRAERVTTIALVVMIAGGVALRLWNVGFPTKMQFDEDHFVLNARAYLTHGDDGNNHPPLGKLAIAVGMLAFGDDSLGWRAASVAWGLQTIILAAALARELFDDRRAGLFAAAFVAADGFFIAYSRSAVLDGGLACLVLWSVLAAACARSWRGVLASAVLVGLAASVKWSGGFAVVPAAVALVWRRRVPKRALLLFGLAPIVHLGLWTAALRLTGHAADPAALLAVMRRALQSHVDNGHLSHGVASRWWSWPIFWRPIVIKDATHGVWHHYASCVGNPLLFLGAALTCAGVIGAAIVSLRSQLARAFLCAFDGGSGFVRACGVLVVGWLALIAPWTGPRSYTFIYHYLPSYGFALVLLAGVVARLERRWPARVAYFACSVLVVAAFYAPVWAELPISAEAAVWRLPFPLWRP
ncbi:MAG TPA: glycosyltransferase family 39 protein [Polyangia bacterium]|nr:glycosyltransferase family 39 protein [Polyangia bacterium]